KRRSASRPRLIAAADPRSVSRWRKRESHWLQIEALTCFGHNLVDHGFGVLSAFPHPQLSVRARPFAQDRFEVRHFALAAELFHFRRDEFEDLVNQTARLQFAAAAEIDQLPAEAIACRAPAIFFEQAAGIN